MEIKGYLFKPSIFDNIRGKIRFDGSDYNPEFDDKRLTGQIKRVFDCMKDGKFRTLSEIEEITGDGQSSISAQLRHMRKERFGGNTVEKQHRGDKKNGLYEYKLILKNK